MRTKIFLIVILLLGFLTRAYQYRERFIYAHDNDLASWIVKDIIVDKHLRLIGQLTSSPGIFIGPFYYYALIPFYLATHMDPLGTVAFSWMVGLTAIASIYFVVSRLHGHRAGMIAALIYAVSYGISSNEREIVPTTPVMLWSIWFYYALHKKSLVLLAILVPLIWHLNLALALLLPLAMINFSSRNWKWAMVIFLILSIPLLIFEVRHGFQQTRALVQTLGHGSSTNNSIRRTLYYALKNGARIFWWEAPL